MSLLAANYVKTCQMWGCLYKLPVHQTAFAVIAAKLFRALWDKLWEHLALTE